MTACASAQVIKVLIKYWYRWVISRQKRTVLEANHAPAYYRAPWSAKATSRASCQKGRMAGRALLAGYHRHMTCLKPVTSPPKKSNFRKAPVPFFLLFFNIFHGVVARIKSRCVNETQKCLTNVLIRSCGAGKLHSPCSTRAIFSAPFEWINRSFTS